MPKKIIRVIETRVWEYSPIDPETGLLEDWYNEDGRQVTTIEEAMEADKQNVENPDADVWAPISDYATQIEQIYEFRVVYVPDDYKPTSVGVGG